MNYFDANKLWEALNEVMLSDERFKGYRPALKHIDGEVPNMYKVEIREAYSGDEDVKPCAARRWTAGGASATTTRPTKM